MKKQLQKIGCFLVTAFMLLSCCGVEAAPRASIGKVDLKALVLLHPAMRSYDPYVQAFKIDPARVAGGAKQRSEEQQSEINRLDSEVRLLQGRIHEMRRNFDREMERIAKNYLDGIEDLATGPRALKKKEYDIAQNRTEVSFNAKIQALGAQLSQAEDRRSRLEKVAYHSGYSDPETTQKQFAAIISEIRQYTQQIATQKGIEVVLNSKSRELKAVARRETVMAPDLNYEKIFRMPFPNEIRNDSAAVNGYYQNITSLAANWLGHGSDILEPFSSQVLDNDVFIGGADLTVEVLAAIFKAYKIDPNVGNAVIQSVTGN
ncbi:MAG: hypothetical protein ACOYXC_07135 [Candidatus Rifleibacteriota bacterium]